MNPLEHCNITLDLEDWQLKVNLQEYYSTFKHHHVDEEYDVPEHEFESKSEVNP